MRPETRAAYPPDWPEIARRIKDERGNRCERCGQVGNLVTGEARGNSYLTVHHLDYDPTNCDPANLMVLCQACHLVRQQKERLGLRYRLMKRGQLPLL